MAVERKQCFYPSGDLMGNDTPCFPNEEVSPCCGLSATCLANGLCYGARTGGYVRGTCTDPKWDSPNCPQYCTESPYTIFIWFSLFPFDSRKIANEYLSIDAFKGNGGKNFSIRSPQIWQCSNRQAAEGGLMCCDIAEVNLDYRNRSCCSGANAINLFIMGSRLGTATSITLSSSSLPSKPSSPAFSLSSSTSLSTTQLSSITNPASSSSLGPLRSSPNPSLETSSPSPSLEISSSSVAQNHSATGGSTIAIAVSTSIGAMILIVAGFFLLYRRRRGSRESENNRLVAEMSESKDRPQEISGPQGFEMSGLREFEVPTGSSYLRPELPE